MAAALKNSGFRVTLKLNATQAEMKSAVQKFGEKLNRNTDALFYYSGHGVQYAGENYLIPIGAVQAISAAEHLRYKAVPTGYALGVMKAAKSPLNIVILDACRNNPFKGFSRNLTRGLARMPSAEGSLIAYGTAPGNVAIDSLGGRNSPYTTHLLSFIRQSGLKLEEVLKKNRSAVKSSTKNQQTPWYELSIDGNFYFVPRNSAAPSLVIPVPPKPSTIQLTVRSNQLKWHSVHSLCHALSSWPM